MSTTEMKGQKEILVKRTAEERASLEKLIKTIGSTFLLGVVQTTQCGSANSSAILAAVGGNTALAARDYATVSTIGAMLEFVTGRLFGKLSDCYGRKPFALLGALGGHPPVGGGAGGTPGSASGPGEVSHPSSERSWAE